ncbi:hypothetical protein N177_3311 [Lutibaculum baratangense AMV1]|uniref:Uncharacterized protein n=1 Tax=Lutibaculum baratangense AMV1 TaxID=631454 RepID=V4T9Q9_9HYPH|nr:hypothetical protein N177_3311 [Lutibaculum baratangense AMV1]
MSASGAGPAHRISRLIICDCGDIPANEGSFRGRRNGIFQAPFMAHPMLRKE